MWLETDLNVPLSSVQGVLPADTEAHGVYTNTEPEDDDGASQADVTLICSVTDCWKQGHLLTFYFCPLFFFVLSICFFCSDLWSQAGPLS